MLSEFRKFIAQGNVLDLAVGVVIGGAFGKISASLVNDIIMPPIGLLLAGVDFKAWKIILQAADAATGKAEVAISIGNFIQIVIEFLVIAYVIFLVVKAANKMRVTDKKADEKA